MAKKTIPLYVAVMACAAAFAGGARLSPVDDAEVGRCAAGVTVFDDREYAMTPAAAERLAGKTFFRRTIEGGFSAEVVKGGELFVITPTEKAGRSLSQGKVLAALGFAKMPGEPFQAFGNHGCDIAEVWRRDVKAGEKISLGKAESFFLFQYA